MPSSTEQTVLGVSAALGSAASWALGAVLFKPLSERMSPMAMTLAKGVISLLLLGVVAGVVGFQSIGRESLWLLILSGLIGIAVADTFFFRALRDLSPFSMIILMMIGQVVTAVLGVFWLGEVPSAQSWVGMGIILFGVAVVLYADIPKEGQSSAKLRGIVFGLIAAVCMAVSIIVAKKPLDEVPTVQATLLRMLSGTVGMFMVGACFGQLGGWITPLKEGRFLAKFVLAVGVIAFGGFWLSLVAVKYLSVAEASAINATEPIFALLLAIFVLHDRIKLASITGALACAVGVYLIVTATGEPSAP